MNTKAESIEERFKRIAKGNLYIKDILFVGTIIAAALVLFICLIGSVLWGMSIFIRAIIKSSIFILLELIPCITVFSFSIAVIYFVYAKIAMDEDI